MRPGGFRPQKGSQLPWSALSENLPLCLCDTHNTQISCVRLGYKFTLTGNVLICGCLLAAPLPPRSPSIMYFCRKLAFFSLKRRRAAPEVDRSGTRVEPD